MIKQQLEIVKQKMMNCDTWQGKVFYDKARLGTNLGSYGYSASKG